MTESLSYYLHHLSRLRRDRSKGGAPHKPVLLLSVLQGIREGWILSNHIYITPELVGAFKDNWNRLVETEHHCLFPLPYFHMQSEKFWRLIPQAGFEPFLKTSRMRTFSGLRKAIACAEIDQELFGLMKQPESGEMIRETLLEKYFPNSRHKLQHKSLIEHLSEEMLSEPSEIYTERLKELQATLDENAYEEEVFIRSGAFRKSVLSAYDHRCAISGLKIVATMELSMLDACHIVPFYQSNDDTISNGIALSPTLHRAFDRGLIGIDEQLKVKTSGHFKEEGASMHSLRQFEGQPIKIPADKAYRPAVEKFAWHGMNVFLS